MNSNLQMPNSSAWLLRRATESDVPALETLVALSVRELHAPYYSREQIEAALGRVFGVDQQLIRDGTYFVVERDGTIVGCGGWSCRRSLYGRNVDEEREDSRLDPQRDAARIRAFFVHPNWARRGIGRSIMAACESAIVASNFRTVDIVATLPGEHLYASYDYAVTERFEIALASGLSLPVVRMTKKWMRDV